MIKFLISEEIAMFEIFAVCNVVWIYSVLRPGMSMDGQMLMILILIATNIVIVAYYLKEIKNTMEK